MSTGTGRPDREPPGDQCELGGPWSGIRPRSQLFDRVPVGNPREILTKGGSMRRTRFAVLLAAVAVAAVALATSSAAAPSPPTATTGAASSVTQSRATLSGTVNPNGQSTTY